jgi:CRP-like cAMP-binding protein
MRSTCILHLAHQNESHMHIDVNLLIAWGGVSKRYSKNETIFLEGDFCKFYYQIIEGKVRMYNYNEEGKIFTQGHFSSGQCFGEPPLFIDSVYPCNAIAAEDCIIIKLLKDSFIKLVYEDKDIMKHFIVGLSQRIYNKTNASKHIISQNPQHRIVAFLNKYKDDEKVLNAKVLVPFTRQEIADFTGLRVETVIRTTKKLYENKVVDIKNHKIYY